MTPTMTHDALTRSGFLTINGFCQWSSLCRTKVYELIAKGDLRPRKCGRRTLVPMEEAVRWQNALPAMTAAESDRDNQNSGG